MLLHDLPSYDQDTEDQPSAAVSRLKEAISRSSGIIFVTPEYNRSLPGTLKNAIDHASRPYGHSVWTGKPAGIVGVSSSAVGTATAQQHLRNILAHLDMPTLGQPEAFIQWNEGLVDDRGGIGPASRDFLQSWMDSFTAWVELHSPSARHDADFSSAGDHPRPSSPGSGGSAEPTRDTIPSFSAMLRLALDGVLSPDATTFVDMFHEAGVMEFPYALPDGVRRLEGRTQLIAYLAALDGVLEIERVSAPVVLRTSDPSIVVLEFNGNGRSVATGRAYEQNYISVIKVSDGRIIHYRDYWNPLIVAQMLRDAEAPPSPLIEDRR